MQWTGSAYVRDVYYCNYCNFIAYYYHEPWSDMFTNPLKLSHTRCRNLLLIIALIIMHELVTMTSLPGNNSLESVGRWRRHLAVDTPVSRSKTIAVEAWTCQCTPAVYTPLQHQTTGSRAMGARRIFSRGQWGGLKDGSPPAGSRGSYPMEAWKPSAQKLKTLSQNDAYILRLLRF